MALKLLALLLVTACSAQIRIFPEGQVCKYQYEGKQASGIPVLQSQWSALGIKCDVYVQRRANDVFHFQLEKCQYGELHNSVILRAWHDLQIPYADINEYRRLLEQPFQMTLGRANKIKQFSAEHNEPIWMVNIKKSIVQPFQADITGETSHDQSRISPRLAADRPSFFRVQEGSVGGQCETLYEQTSPLSEVAKDRLVHEIRQAYPEIQWPASQYKHPMSILYKTRNYERSQERPTYQHLMPPTLKCHSVDCHLTATNHSVSSRYILDGDNSNFNILAIFSEAEFLVYPYGMRTEQLWTVTNQTFIQIKCTKSALQQLTLHSPVVYPNLTFQYPTTDGQALRLPDVHAPPQTPAYLPGIAVEKIKYQQLQRKIFQLMISLEQQIQTLSVQPQTHAASIVLEVERAMSFLGYDQLIAVQQQMLTTVQKTLFLDILVATGTSPALMVVVNAIKHQNVSAQHASTLISTIPMHIKTPTAAIIRELLQLAASISYPKTPQPRITAALAIGNIFHQVCVNNNTVYLSYPTSLYGSFCTDEVHQLMVQYILQLQSKIDSEPASEKTAYIQAIGNIGHPKIIPVLKKYILERNNKVLSSKAIYALYRLTDKHREPAVSSVRAITSTVFHDITRSIDVRLAALAMTLATDPPLAYWQKMAISTWEEPSEQVVSAVHSAFNTLANQTEIQPISRMGRKAAAVLGMIRAPPKGLAFSSAVYTANVLLPRLQAGYSGKFSAISDQNSVIPNTLFAQIMPYINGDSHNAIKAALTIHNAQQIVNYLYTNRNASNRPSILLPKPLDDILHLLEDWNLKLNASQPNVTLYTQLVGTMDRFFAFNNLMQYITDIPAGTNNTEINLHGVVYSEDKVAQYPSELGFPVIYTRKSPYIVSVEGNVQTKVDYQRAYYEVQHSVKHANFISMTRNMVSTVSPFSYNWLGSGIDSTAEASLPVGVKASFNAREMEAEFSANLPQASANITVVYREITPFTNANPVAEFASLPQSPQYKPIHPYPQPEFVYPYGSPRYISGYVKKAGNYPTDFPSLYDYWKELTTRTSLQYYSPIEPSHLQITVELSSAIHSVSFIVARTNNLIVDASPQAVSTQPTELRRRLSSEIQQAQQRIDEGYGIVGVFAAYPGGESSGSPIAQLTSFLLRSHAPSVNKQVVFFTAHSASHKACGDFVYRTPQTSNDRSQLLIHPSNTSVYGNFGYGNSSCVENTVHLDGRITTDPLAIQYARTCPQAKRCETHEQQGLYHTSECEQATDLAALISKVDLVFSTKQITRFGYNVLYKLDSVVKYMLWPYMDNNHFEKNRTDQVGVTLQLDPYNNSINIGVYKPYEKTTFSPIHLPYYALRQPNQLTLRRSLSQKLADVFFGQDTDSCFVDSHSVKTFDNVTIKTVPPPQCHVLLTASYRTPSQYLMVLAKDVNKMKAIQIRVDGQVIDIRPVSLAKYTVKINNTIEQPLSDGQLIPVLSPQGAPPLAYISMARETATVALPTYHAEVQLHYESAHVYMNPLLHRNRVIGACGDLNGEQTYDRVDPYRCVHQESQSFLRQYYVPLQGDSCQPPIPLQPGSCVKQPFYRP